MCNCYQKIISLERPNLMVNLPPCPLLSFPLFLSAGPKPAPHLITYSLNRASSQEMLNFGLDPSDSGPRTMELLILNSGTRPVTLTSLVATPVTDALAVEFASVKVILLVTL